MPPARKLGSLGAGFATVASAFVSATVGVVLLSACGSCEGIVRQSAFPVLAAGTFDGIEADQSEHRLFFADQTVPGVDIVDLSGAQPRFAGTVGLPAAPNGLAFAPHFRRLYAAMDGGQVAVIDMDRLSQKYLQVVNEITVDPTSADLVEYSAKTNNLYVGSGTAVVVVDTTTGKVANRFEVGSPVEQPRYNSADGKLYVTTPHTDTLLQLDPSTGQVLRRYVQKKCRPKGVGINPSRGIALVACGSSMAVFNLRTGLDEITRTVPGGDIVTYDPNVDRFTVGSSHGPRDSSVGVFSGDARYMGIVASSPNAHGAVFDDATGLVYAVSSKGLLSFSPAACAPLPDWLTFIGGASVFIVPLVGFGLFLVWYARRRSRIDPKAPKPKTWEELRKDDLEAERERMRELEDAIYGPPDG